MTKKKSLTILLLMVIVVGLSLHYYKQHQAKQAAELAAKQIKPMEVLVTQIIKQDVPMTKEWVGTTQGDVNADIFPKVSGYLLKMNYDEGSTVQAGQLLFEIDSRPYQAAVDAAQGDLEKAYANQKNLSQM